MDLTPQICTWLKETAEELHGAHWNGEVLDSEAAVLGFAQNMTYAGKHPAVSRAGQTYSKGVRRSKEEMKLLERRLVRQPDLPKWAVTIAPPKAAEIILPS